MLRTRLFLGLLPLLLVIIGTGAYSIRVCHQLAGPLQQDLVSNYRLALGCQEMRNAATLMSNALAFASGSDPIGSRKALEARRAAFTKELMEQTASSAGRPRARAVEELDEAFGDFSERCERSLAAGGSASLLEMRANEDALYKVLSTLDRINAMDSIAMRETAAKAEQLASTAVDVLVATIAAAIALSLLLAWFLASLLLRPIKALTLSAAALGEGNLDTHVPEFSGDELGRLARAFNTMADKLRAYRDATVARVLRTQRTMEATLTSTPDPLFVVSREGRIEVRNPAAEQLSRLPEFSDGLPKDLADHLATVLEGGEHYVPTDYSKVLTCRVGREDRHFLPRILSIGDKLTEFKGAAVILQDVTKFRLLDDAKTNFVGTVSHELKTPLTGLRMAVYLLLEKTLGPLEPGQREMLESARDDADRLMRILDSLLDLTRLESGASSLEREPVEVGSLLEDIVKEADPMLKSAGRSLVVACEPGLPAVSVDAGRLRHVFINLLSNAAKYSPQGGLVTLRASLSADHFIRFAVHDTGGAIPSEVAPRLFDRFYRVPGQSQPGAGIGLAIAREIVVAHGGTIGCTSSPAEGTEFHFLVPAA